MARRLAGGSNNNGLVSDPPPVNARAASNRRREIVEKAAEFFATVGFEGGTRDFAKYLGTTQPLLYRYFPTKEALIQEVYQMVYVELWDDKWDAVLIDERRLLRDRLIAFYISYTDVIMNAQWMRLYLFAGLKGVEINARYITLVEERIIKVIVREVWKERKLPAPKVFDKRDLEIVWNLQGGIFYFGVRANVYNVPTYTDKNEMITNAVDIFLTGYAKILERRFQR
jgi:AcrR family transcriptional regulator